LQQDNYAKILLSQKFTYQTNLCNSSLLFTLYITKNKKKL
jgi:hypothetical protein